VLSGGLVVVFCIACSGPMDRLAATRALESVEAIRLLLILRTEKDKHENGHSGLKHNFC
jgi:hypothetical protein